MSQIVMVMRRTAPTTNLPEYGKRFVRRKKPQPL